MLMRGKAPLLVLVPVVVLIGTVLVVNHQRADTPPTPAGSHMTPEATSPAASRVVLDATAAASAAVISIPAPTTPATNVPVQRSGPLAPELRGGGAWLNSPPLQLAALRGKVVLVSFWTYGCYNCQNTLPYVKQWWSRYKDQGFVIIGVHTPEFDSEHDLGNVQAAVQQDGIGWPVVQDNDWAIWNAYGNHYWPHFYLINSRGQIIYDHIGEGAYDETERQIADALAAAHSS